MIDSNLTDLQAWLVWIPLLPFLGAALLGLAGWRMPRGAVSLIACGTVGASALLSLVILLGMAVPSVFAPPRVFSLTEDLGTWFAAGGLEVRARLFVDHLGAVMIAVVTGVSFLIHVYSTEYMRGDPGYARYFAYLNLFVGFMLVLVLADNLVLLFVGWEGVGLCSYLLIGFWYEDDAKAYAGRKAFVVNRIGDAGFLVGIFTLLALLGTTNVQEVAAGLRGLELAAPAPSPLGELGLSSGGAITLACVALFLGATGKSAQFPLYVWLPDAMAGPTPVSALIHAATMVSAGVYLIARLSFLFALSTPAMVTIALIGAFTALFAALMAFAQNDIKKVLAYSTVSQLGFMIFAVGLGAFWQGVFHLVTHAFFKALLFLGAGAVILACHHEHDIQKMGGLRRRMPRTGITFLIGTLAITGGAPLSGFFSKDAILHFASTARLGGFAWIGPVIWGVGLAAALCTAFYMFRLYFLVFEGTPRSGKAEAARDRGAAVNVPLWALATLAVVALVWGFPWAPLALPVEGGLLVPIFERFTRPAFSAAEELLSLGWSAEHGGVLRSMLIALGIAWVGLTAAFLLYRQGLAERFKGFYSRRPGRWLYALVANKFYVDEIYDVLVVGPFKALAFVSWQILDVFAIDTVAVRGSARLTAWTGAALRTLQNGDVQRYAAVMAIGAVLLWATIL